MKITQYYKSCTSPHPHPLIFSDESLISGFIYRREKSNSEEILEPVNDADKKKQQEINGTENKGGAEEKKENQHLYKVSYWAK